MNRNNVQGHYKLLVKINDKFVFVVICGNGSEFESSLVETDPDPTF
jgi:hypothetical protein